MGVLWYKLERKAGDEVTGQHYEGLCQCKTRKPLSNREWALLVETCSILELWRVERFQTVGGTS